MIVTSISVTFVGCSILQPVADQTAYYRLSATHLEARSADSLTEMPLGQVVRVRFPDDVHEGKLMITEGSNRVFLFDDARWMEPFERAFERTLDLNVRALSSGLASNASVKVDVLSFVADESRVSCKFSYIWNNEPGKQGVAEVTANWAGLESLDTLAAAIDQITAQMASVIAGAQA
ncbi:MAG: ABC-type transport auxiliary lipoprotein family protein [Verrucomicrobiota bacterium]